MNGKRLIFRLLSVSLLFLLSFNMNAEGDMDKGKALFKNKCATCHNKNMKSDLTGPALGGSRERWAPYPAEDFYTWVRNSKSMLETHPRGKELWAEYKPNQMDLFPDLTDADIDDIFAYVDEVFVAGCYPCLADAPGVTSVSEDKGSNTWLYWLLFVTLAVLAVVLTRIVANLNYMAQVNAGEDPGPRKTLVDILTSRGIVTFVIFALIVLGGYTTVNNAVSFGRQQAYAPAQPIKFSHELHAGIHQIDCQYCHDGARRSKHAVIPAVNTCMNCHEAVKEGPEYGTEEIQKIYDAAGWDGKAYTGKETPIEWTRIHNLPDHVYFNHSQHVIAGKVECQTCHGKVEQMEVVEQYAPLSMGWCVNCHRETKVDFDNEYYDSWKNYHEEIENGNRDKVTVGDVGGLECQKCHY